MRKQQLSIVTALVVGVVFTIIVQGRSSSGDEYLQVLLMEGKYKQIEEIMGKVLKSGEKDRDGRSVLYEKYIELTMLPSYETEDLKRCVDMHLEWVKKHPNSHFANAALGKAYVVYAWNARTNRYGKYVGKKRWKIFKERIRVAQKYLLKAYELDPTDPAVPVEMIHVAKVHPDTSGSTDAMEEWFQKAIASDPTDLKAYRSKLNLLQPRWGGSFAKELAFGRETLKNAPENSMAPWVLIKAHWHIHEKDKSRNYFRKSKIWGEMKETFTELEKRFPESIKIQNWFARTAYLAGDFKTAKTEFSKIGDNWHREVWDNREDFEASKKLSLETDSGRAAIKQQEKKNDLKTLLKKKQYKKIEEILYEVLAKKEINDIGRRVIHAKVNDLSTSSGNTTADIKNYIEMHLEWVKTHPNSHFANASLGVAYVNYAWYARGAGYASSVSEDGWKAFHDNITLAATYLKKAYELDPSDPVVPVEMIVVSAVGGGRSFGEFDKWFDRAVEADPVDSMSYDKKLYFTHPKWGGSFRRQLVFSRQIYKNAPANSMAPILLTETHWEIYKDRKDPHYFSKKEVWEEMKDVYGELTKRFPQSVKIRNWYARTACMAGDYETAKAEFSKLGNNWHKEVWKHRQKYEYHKHLASTGKGREVSKL